MSATRPTLLLLAVALLPSAALGWGKQGHSAVATLAAAQLTPHATAEVQALLADDLDRHGGPSQRTTLAAIASWPDEIRDLAPKGAYKGWHTRANPVCGTALGPCRDGRCVDELLVAYAAVLGDRRASPRERNEALKWVVHLVGDLHQPLHSGVGPEGGGIGVAAEGMRVKAGTSLHDLWDHEIGNRAVALAPLVAAAPDAAAPDAAVLAAAAPTQWMLEARDVARRQVYEPIAGFACGQRLVAPVALDAGYVERSATVARTQIERAGARLAQLLNQLLAAPAP
jgi:hypothetical protein